jgi:tetratricopeptide (TPR) repeat protein
MYKGMRHVFGGAALVAGILLQSIPAFAQLQPWAQQDRRRAAPPQHQQVRPPQQQQAQPQQKPRPEPVQNVQERAACLNKDTPQAALIEACTVVIEAGKDRPAAMATMYFNRGEAYREKGNLDSAIKDLGDSIDLDGKNANAYFGRGTALRAKGELDAAIADFDQAIKADPRNPTYYSTRSHAYYEKRDYERAIQDLTQAIKLNPRNTLAIYNRGMAYRAKG